MPSCWLSPESGPWKPIFRGPWAGLPMPAPVPHCAFAALPPPPELLLLLLLQAVRASGITSAPAASDASRRVVEERTRSPRKGAGVGNHPIGLDVRPLRA